MRKAFTLIELLTVIAIIAVLAAILFPVFAAARESARRTACLSNVHQVALAMLMYQGDYDERLPLVYTRDDTRDALDLGLPALGRPNAMAWTVSVRPYMRSLAVLLCSDGRKSRTTGDTFRPVFSGYGSPPVSAIASRPYWTDTPAFVGPTVRWQGLLGNAGDSNWYDAASGRLTPADSLVASQIARPAETLLASDAGAPDWYIAFWARTLSVAIFDECDGPYGYPQQRFGPLPIHGGNWDASLCVQHLDRYAGAGTVSCAFADGHVKSLHLADVFATMVTGDGATVYSHLWPEE